MGIRYYLARSVRLMDGTSICHKWITEVINHISYHIYKVYSFWAVNAVGPRYRTKFVSEIGIFFRSYSPHNFAIAGDYSRQCSRLDLVMRVNMHCQYPLTNGESSRSSIHFLFDRAYLNIPFKIFRLSPRLLIP